MIFHGDDIKTWFKNINRLAKEAKAASHDSSTLGIKNWQGKKHVASDINWFIVEPWKKTEISKNTAVNQFGFAEMGYGIKICRKL